MKIYKEKSGVISKEPVWVCIQNRYLYTHNTLIGLLWTIITEYQEDKHLSY